MGSFWVSIAIVLQCLLFALVAGEPTAVVNTTSGPVQGEILRTVGRSMRYGSFKGIKYGEAPIGYLRFKPPLPARPWTEVMNTTRQAVECPQLYGNTVQGAEDCLYLNVYTPVLEESPKKLRSVMVYIYGGGFVTGFTNTVAYGADYLVERGVVVVDMNYRMGALGFLSLNHPNATGNAGLKDQNLALRWVQKNIEKFGGDPKNVTLFGQSAGSVSVSFHTVSDASAGLFHAAICMSGVTFSPWGFAVPSTIVRRAKKLGVLLGTVSKDPEDLLKRFYEASVEELVRATSSVGVVSDFVPTIENASVSTEPFLTVCTLRKYLNGNFSQVRQIIGFMQQEVVTYVHDPSAFAGALWQAQHIEYSPLLNRVSQLLTMAGNSSLEIEPDLLQDAVKETSERIFMAQIDMSQRLVANNNAGNPVFYYHITFDTPRSIHNLLYHTHINGSGHADELGYIFNKPWANYSLELSDPVGLTIYRMCTMWTNFAKYGHPTPHWIDEDSLNVTWPESGTSGLALEIGNELTVGPRPISNDTRFIQETIAQSFPEMYGCY